MKGEPSVNYYFGSGSINPDAADNQISILINKNGSAIVKTTLHAKAISPPNLGSAINITIPFSKTRIDILSVKMNNHPVNYYPSSKDNLTNVEVNIPDSIMEAYIQIEYSIDKLYSQEKLNFIFLPSAKITELSIIISFPIKENIWIKRDSVELLPPSSEETYFCLNKDVYPFIMNMVLSNVNPKAIKLNLNTTKGTYSLVNTPYIALVMGITPVILISLIYNLKKIIGKKVQFSVFSIAYRNIFRRKSRSLLTIIGISTSVILLVLMITQEAMIKQMIDISLLPEIKWGWIFTLIIITIVSSFQIITCLYSSILERYKEYGVMKAIGFSPRFVINMVTFESLLIGLMAGLIGSILSSSFIFVSSDILYGESPEIFSNIMFQGYGVNYIWMRNNMLSFVLVLFIGINIVNYTISPDASILMIIPMYSYLIFFRPYDPFTLERFFNIAPIIIKNCLISILFSTSICSIIGLFFSRQASKIKPTEAMRHI